MVGSGALAGKLRLRTALGGGCRPLPGLLGWSWTCCCCCCALSCACRFCFSICGTPTKYCHTISTSAESTMARIVFFWLSMSDTLSRPRMWGGRRLVLVLRPANARCVNASVGRTPRSAAQMADRTPPAVQSAHSRVPVSSPPDGEAARSPAAAASHGCARRVPDPLRHGESRPAPVHHRAGLASAARRPMRGPLRRCGGQEVSALPEPLQGQYAATVPRQHQAVSRLRPRARRAATTLRPPVVFRRWRYP